MPNAESPLSLPATGLLPPSWQGPHLRRLGDGSATGSHPPAGMSSIGFLATLRDRQALRDLQAAMARMPVLR